MAQTNTVKLTIFIALGVTGLMIIAAIGNAQAASSKSSERWCMKLATGEGKDRQEHTQCFPDLSECRAYEDKISKLSPRVIVLESCHRA
jgi:Spy/CpxP family protein refolding chaperone